MPKASTTIESTETTGLPLGAPAARRRGRQPGATITKKTMKGKGIAPPKMAVWQSKIEPYARAYRKGFRSGMQMLSPAETFILFHASTQSAPTTASMIGTELTIDKVAVARSLGRLSKLGLIELTQSTEGDRRQSLISVTSAGNSWLKAFSSLMP